MEALAGDKAVPPRPDVFISYSRKDSEFVRRLEKALERRGREAWVDWEGIRPTEEFMQAIYRAIEGTDTFVFVISPDSIGSEICARELTHAATHNKRMVPIVVRDVDAKAVPEPLAKLNWLFFRETDGFDAATETLISALDTDLDWVHGHTRLLTRAIEWEAKAKSNSFVLRGEDLRAAEQWLAQAGTEKERQPTALQTEYIIASRKASSKRQRITLGAVTTGAVVALVLAAVAWTQRTKAVQQGIVANENAIAAREAEQRAIINANTAKRTSAQADYDLAVMYQRGANLVDPRSLAHLARSLRTLPEASRPRRYLVSLLRDRPWDLALTEPLRHEARVRAAAFSLDGARIVTASDDKTARIWDATTGLPIGEPMRHGDKVVAAAFSPDGGRIVTASDDLTAQIWDGGTGRALGEPMRHQKAVQSAVFSVNGTRILTKAGGNARIWDASTGRPVSESLGDAMTLYGAADFSADGTRVVSVTAGNVVQIWDSRTGKPQGEPLRESGVWGATLSADGLRVATVSDNKAARFWDARTFQPQGQPMLHETGVRLVRFNADGTRIVTGSSYGTARIWDAQTCKPVGEPMRHSGTVNAVAFNADGTRIITHHYGGDACLWDAKTGKLAGEVLRHDVDRHPPVFSPDGSRLVTLSRTDHIARVWDAKTGRPLGEPLRHEAAVTAVSFSANGSQLVTASNDHSARVWNVGVTPPKCLVLPLAGKERSDKVESVNFSPNGARLVATDSHTARIWEVETGLPVGEPLRHTGDVFEASFSSDGSRIVTASHDHTARIWDAETGRPMSAPLQHGAEVSSANFSMDGTRIVTASMDHTARIWDASRGQPLGEPLRHADWVVSARFSADSEKIVTVSNRTAQIWDTKTGQPFGKPMQAAGDVHDAIFNADSSRVLTVGSGEAQIWNATSGEPVGEPLKGMAQDAGFSADGTRVLAASTAHKVMLWDATTGQSLREPPPGTVQAAGFSNDGALILTNSVGREEARIWDATTGTPVTEMLPSSAQIISGSFNRDGTRAATTADGLGVQIWDVAVDVKASLPSWVSSLAEALGGQRLDEDGRVLPPEKSIFVLRKELMDPASRQALKGHDFWSRFGRWFFMRGPDRTISPDSKITVGEWERLQREREQKPIAIR